MCGIYGTQPVAVNINERLMKDLTLADITVDAGDIVRSVADQLELPKYPDDWVQETTSEQDADLGKMVAATIREWIKKHNLKLTRNSSDRKMTQSTCRSINSKNSKANPI